MKKSYILIDRYHVYLILSLRQIQSTCAVFKHAIIQVYSRAEHWLNIIGRCVVLAGYTLLNLHTVLKNTHTRLSYVGYWISQTQALSL